MPRNAPRDVPMLSDADERALQAEIAQDDDAPELTDAQLAEMRPASEVLPPALFKALARRGRPRSENKRVQVTLRIDPAVVDGYKAGGPGWQTRMNEALQRGLPSAVIVEGEGAGLGDPRTSRSAPAVARRHAGGPEPKVSGRVRRERA